MNNNDLKSSLEGAADYDRIFKSNQDNQDNPIIQDAAKSNSTDKVVSEKP